jgi:hypothetical protein
MLHTKCPKSTVEITLEVDFVGRHAHRKYDDDLWHPLNDLGCRGNGKEEKNEDDPAMACHWMDYRLGELIAYRINAEGLPATQVSSLKRPTVEKKSR